jgi:TetR/AcrR family transcriptional regulator
MKEGRGRKEKNINVKERILQAASEEFAEYGFKDARIERIAKRSNMNKAMLYYYFGSKEELYKAALEYVIGKVKSNFMAFGERTYKDTKEFLDYLIEALFRIHLSIEYSAYSSLIVKDMIFGKKHIHPILKEKILPLIERVLLDAIGFFRRDNIKELDPILVIVFISLIITSIEFKTRFSESPVLKSILRDKDTDYMKEQIKKIFLKIIDCYKEEKKEDGK